MGTDLGPEAAYRFARGEEVTSNTGQRAKLARPLDFLVVADHAGFYGVAPALKRGDEAILADPKGREWYDAFNSGPEGYKRGVPMGGDLTNAPSGKAPAFMIRALRDPDNANLDRVQVIKGWHDKGEVYERIYDVACSDGRAIVNRRCEREVGSTVDLSVPSYTNTIGDPLLTAHWVDPDFDPDQRAFYYVRVIEIPKPRWTAYDSVFFNVDMGEDTLMTIQDRAYTSPIWYTP